MTFKDYLTCYHQVLSACVVTTAHQTLSVDQAMELLLKKLSALKTYGQRLFCIGNGGSAAIASHYAIDCWKAGIRAQTFNDPCSLTSLSNDFSYEEVFSRPLELFADPDDLLIAISSSGQSRNIHRAVAAARQKECYIVTLSGFQPSNPLRTVGDLNFYLPYEHYGIVEIGHQMLLHYLVDTFCQRQAPRLVECLLKNF